MEVMGTTPEAPMTACGPSLPMACMRSCVRTRQRARRAVPAEGSGFVGRPLGGPTALRCSASGGPGATRFVRCALCAQTLPGESVHEARCARSAQCLRFSPTLYSPSTGTARRASQHRWRADNGHATAAAAKPARAGLRRASEATRNGGFPARARSALRQLTLRRECLSVESAANEASCPPGRDSEYRSGVGPPGPTAEAKRRGPARAGFAASAFARKSGRTPPAAKGRTRPVEH